MTAIAKPFQEQTYYELLEISPQASMEEIHAAYHRAIELYSPESVAIYALENPTLAEELRAKLQEAMEILTDTDLRPEYDRSIGLLARPAPDSHPDEDEDDEEEEEESADAGKAAFAEVMPPPEAVDSTYRELKVSYVADKPAAPAPEAPAEAKADLRPPREAAPVIASQNAIGEAEAALAQVAAKVREREAPRPDASRPEGPKSEAPKPRSAEIAQDVDFCGELIRRAREAKGLSIQQLAERTRISSRHIENIEADRYKELPATVYLRGMLTSVAREIGLDPLRVAKSYLALAARAGRIP